MVKYLCEAGADINKAMKDGETPFFAAVRLRNFEIVKYLCQAGADINKAMTNRETPLFAATRLKNFEIFKYLLEHGAKTPGDQTLFDYMKATLIDHTQPLSEEMQNTLSEIHNEISEKREIALKYSGNPLAHKAIDNNKHKEFDKTASIFMKYNHLMTIKEFNDICADIPTSFEDDFISEEQMNYFLLATHHRAGKESIISTLPHDIIHSIISDHALSVDMRKIIGCTTTGETTDSE